jgi:hypothetical protein
MPDAALPDRMTWAAILTIGGRIDESGATRRLELA